MSTFKELFRKVLRRVWWLSGLFPLLFAGLMLTGLIYLIYSGQPQMQLSRMAEVELMRLSLNVSSFLHNMNERELPLKRPVIVVNIRDRGAWPMDQLITRYRVILQKAARTQASTIVFALKPQTNMTDVPAFSADLSRIPASLRSFIAFPMREIELLPQELRKATTILDDDVCNFAHLVPVQCAYSESFDDWIVQIVAKEARSGDHTTARWVSALFNSSRPTYILNIPPPAALPMLDEEEFLQSEADYTDAVIIVGDGSAFDKKMPNTPASALRLISNLWLPDNPEHEVDTGRVITTYDWLGGRASKKATPLHIFWGQLFAMHNLGWQVSVPEAWIMRSVTVLFCLMIGLVLLLTRAQAPTALGVYLCYALTGWFVNGIAIHAFRVYVPLFDSIFWGLVVLVAIQFTMLSVSTFRRWQLEERRRSHMRAHDVKSNFISLFSHNLNTPIAKMQGTLSVLLDQPIIADWKRDVAKADSIVALLDLSVKSVLTRSAIEEGATTLTARSVRHIADDFRKSYAPLLRRLGIEVQVGVSVDNGDDELTHLPLSFDARGLSYALLAATALFREADASKPLTVRVTLSTQTLENAAESDFALICNIECKERWIPCLATNILKSEQNGDDAGGTGTDFQTVVFARLMKTVATSNRGWIELVPKGQGGGIMMAFQANQ